MTFEIFIGLACITLAALCGLGYLYCKNNVRLTYKEQRIPMEVQR